MNKGGWLAWKLCGEGRVVSTVVDRGSSGVSLEVYRREEGGRNNEYIANKCNTKHNIAIRGDKGDLTQCRVILAKGDNIRESIPGVCRFRTKGPEGNGCMFVMLGMRD